MTQYAKGEIMMTRNVNAIARYILGYFSNLGQSISNLQLQKLLYFCWIAYFKKTGEPLFDEPFVAWPLGPVVESVYYDFCAYGGFPIFSSPSCLPEGVRKNIIDGCLNEYRGWSGYRLVAKSHRRGGAWDVVYNDKRRGKGAVIPPELIVHLECGQRG